MKSVVNEVMFCFVVYQACPASCTCSPASLIEPLTKPSASPRLMLLGCDEKLAKLKTEVAVVGGGGGAAATVMVNAGSAAEPADVLALITMFLSVPTSAATGVPESKPFALLKVAQAGLFAMLKLTV